MTDTHLHFTKFFQEILKVLRQILSSVHQPSFSSECKHERIYDNKAVMSLLGIKERYLKNLRDNGYLGYSRRGDKYRYTQSDIDRFHSRFHFDPFADKYYKY